MTYLEKGQEEIQLFLRGSTIKTNTAGIEESAHKANPEEIIRHVQRV